MHPQHTPTPWHVGRIVGHFCGVYAERGAQIADCTSPDFFPEDSKRNAAFIVRAVNNHAQLVAALDDIEAASVNLHCALQSTAHMDPQDSRIPAITGQVVRDLLAIAGQARAALSAAKEGQQ